MKHVSIEILRKCPNNCMHCSSDSGPKKDDFIIKYEEIKKVFDGLSEIGVEAVSISGGEPFLHQDLLKVVKYGKEKGFKIFIYTSGIMLDENDSYIPLKEKLIEELNNAKVDKLIFNLQSLKPDV